MRHLSTLDHVREPSRVEERANSRLSSGDPHHLGTTHGLIAVVVGGGS